MFDFGRRQFLGSALAAGAAPLVLGAGKADPFAQDLSSIGKTPHTKLAINIEMWFGGMSYPDRIKKTAALGFTGVEMWPWRGKDLDAIKKACDETGVTITQFTGWGFSPGLNDPKNHDKFIAEIEAGCEVAKKLNVKKMCIVAGQDIPGKTQKEMHDAVVAGLKRAAPIAEKNDVMLVLEPMNIRVDHKGHCLYGSAGPIDIITRVNSSHVKILWDIYHQEIEEGDLCRHIREAYPLIGYFQLADNPGRNEPGTGEINYRRVFQELEQLGYKDYVGCECTPSGDPVEAAKRMVEFDRW